MNVYLVIIDSHHSVSPPRKIVSHLVVINKQLTISLVILHWCLDRVECVWCLLTRIRIFELNTLWQTGFLRLSFYMIEIFLQCLIVKTFIELSSIESIRGAVNLSSDGSVEYEWSGAECETSSISTNFIFFAYFIAVNVSKVSLPKSISLELTELVERPHRFKQWLLSSHLICFHCRKFYEESFCTFSTFLCTRSWVVYCHS